MRKKTTSFLLSIFGLICISAVFHLTTGLGVFSDILGTVAFILASASYICLRSKLNFGYVLMVTAVPLSLLKALIDLQVMLQSIAIKRVDAFFEMTELLVVIFAGAFCTSVGYFLAPKEVDFSKTNALKFHDLLILLVMMGCWLAASKTEFSFLTDGNSLLLIVGFITLSFAGGSLKNQKPSISLCNGSIAAMLFGIIIGAVFYFDSQDDPTVLGPIIAMSILTSAYGCVLYYFSFLYASLEVATEEIDFTTKNWHLIEAFGFMLFLIYGPPTIWENMGLG